MAFRNISAIIFLLIIAGSPIYAQVWLSEGVVVVASPNGASITGQVCNYSTQKCAEIESKQGTARVAMTLKNGDLVGFSGSFNEVKADFVEVFEPKRNFDWLERAALVLAGAIAGLIGNVVMAWYTDSRKDNVEQRSKFRSWRDAVLKKIKQRQNGDTVKFSVELPEGLSKKTSVKIHALEAKLLALENKLHAQPEEAEKLLTQARELFVSPSS